MNNTRLIKLLRSFSTQEWQELKKFAEASFFNQRKEVNDLLACLEKPLRNGQTAPEKEEIFRRLFGQRPFDDHRVRMAASFTYQLCCRYLSVRDFMDDEPLRQLRLSALLRKRQLSAQFEQTYAEAFEARESQTVRNADFFEERYQLLLEKYRFDLDRQKPAELNLQPLSDQLDQAFMARKLWQSCFMLSHQAVSNLDYTYGLLEQTLPYIEAQPQVLDTPALAVYYYCYRALTNPGEKSYFIRFKSLVLQQGHLFPPEELRDLYILAINFCIRQYNAGSQDYLVEQFEFYKDGFERQYFLVDGILSRYTYLNAATIGLVMQELQWVETFIHRYRDSLPESHREPLFCFNLARLEYQRRKLGEALQLLQKADYKDVLLNLAAKTLQMKIFYELDEYDLLDAHLQAIKTFIQRKKLMGYHRENYLNTVHFTQKLLELNPMDKQAIQALRTEIEATKSIAEKAWLLQQLS